MAEGAAGSPGPTSGSASPAWPVPTTRRGWRPGTIFVGLALPGRPAETREMRVPGDRERVRQYGAISALDLLRRGPRRPLGLTTGPGPALHRRPTARVTLDGHHEVEPVSPGRYGQ